MVYLVMGDSLSGEFIDKVGGHARLPFIIFVILEIDPEGPKGTDDTVLFIHHLNPSPSLSSSSSSQ